MLAASKGGAPVETREMVPYPVVLHGDSQVKHSQKTQARSSKTT